MNMKFSLSILLGLMLAGAVSAQDGISTQDQNSAATAGQNRGRQGMGMGRRGGGMSMMGRGITGTVSEAAARINNSVAGRERG